MCDSPIWVPKCEICGEYRPKEYVQGETIPKDETGSRWECVCKKCWNDTSTDKNIFYNRWNCFRKTWKGSYQYILKGELVSFGLYMKGEFGTNEHCKGLEKYVEVNKL